MPETGIYTDKVYTFLKDKHGEEFKKDQEQFNQAMQDKEYQRKVYSFLKQNYGNEFKKTEQEFYTALGPTVTEEPSILESAMQTGRKVRDYLAGKKEEETKEEVKETLAEAEVEKEKEQRVYEVDTETKPLEAQEEIRPEGKALAEKLYQKREQENYDQWWKENAISKDADLRIATDAEAEKWAKENPDQLNKILEDQKEKYGLAYDLFQRIPKEKQEAEMERAAGKYSQLMYGVKEGFRGEKQAKDDAKFVAKNFVDNRKGLLDYFEEEYIKSLARSEFQNTDMFSTEGIGNMIGGEISPIIRTGGAGIVAGLLTRSPAISRATTAVVGAADAAQTGFGASFRQSYFEARHLGKSKEEAANIALNMAWAGAAGGGVEGALGAVPLFDKLGKYVSKSQVVKNIAGKAIDVITDASVAGASQIGQNIYGETQDLQRGWTDGVTENMLAEAMFSTGMNVGFGILKTPGSIKRYVETLPPDKQKQVADNVIINAAEGEQDRAVNEYIDNEKNRLINRPDNEQNRIQLESLLEDPVEYAKNQKDRLEFAASRTDDANQKRIYEREIEKLDQVIKSAKPEPKEEVLVEEVAEEVREEVPEEVSQEKIKEDEKEAEIREREEIPAVDEEIEEEGRKEPEGVGRLYREEEVREEEVSEPRIEGEEVEITEGGDVFHRQFGEGEVESIDGDNVTVKFEEETKVIKRDKLQPAEKRPEITEEEVGEEVRREEELPPVKEEPEDEQRIFNEMDDINRLIEEKPLDEQKQTIKDYVDENKDRLKGVLGKYFPTAVKKINEADTPGRVRGAIKYMQNIVEKSETKVREIEVAAGRKRIKSNIRKKKFGINTPDVQEFSNINPKVFKQEGLKDLLPEYERLTGELGTREAEVRFKPKELNDLMNKISEKIEPEDVKETQEIELTPEEIVIREKQSVQEKDNIINRTKDITLEADNKDQQELVNELKNIKREELDLFSDAEVKNLDKIIDNIDNGFVSNKLYNRYIRKIRQKRAADVIGPTLDKVKEDIPELAKGMEEATDEMKDLKKEYGEAIPFKKFNQAIKKTPMYMIDKAVGAKGREIWKKTWQPAVRAKERISKMEDTHIEEINKHVDKIKKQRKKLFDSTALLEMYARANEHEANDGKGNILEGYIENLDKSNISESDKVRIIELYETVPKKADGNIDLDQFWKDLKPAEREFYNYTRQLNEEVLKPLVKHSEVFMREGVFNEQNEYSPRRSADADMQNPEDIVEDLQSKQTGAMKNIQSAKSSASYDRAGTKSIKFDFIGNAVSNLKSVAYDYNMTPVLKELFGTLDMLEKQAKSQSGKNVIKAIKQNYKTALTQEYMAESVPYTIDRQLLNIVTRNAYNSALAGLERVPAEMASNLAGAFVYDPGSIMRGFVQQTKNKDAYKDLMDYVDTPHAKRFGRNTDDHRRMFNEQMRDFIDYEKSIGKKAVDFLDKNHMQKITDWINRGVITISDKTVAEPFWIGRFNKEFKKTTGRDFNPEQFKTEEYKNRYDEQIKEAATNADYGTNELFNTASSLDKAIASKSIDEKGRQKILNQVKSFLWSYSLNEYHNAMKGIGAIRGKDGEMTKTQGTALLSSVLLKNMIYASVLPIMNALLKYPMDEEEAKKDLEEATSPAGAARNVVGSLMGVGLGGYNNIARYPFSYLGEMGNKVLTEEAFGEDYDKFKHSVFFMPADMLNKPNDLKNVSRMMGIYSPAITAGIDWAEIVNKQMQPEPKTRKGKLNAKERMYWDMVTAGSNTLNLFMGIPLYRDVKKYINMQKRKSKKPKRDAP